MENVVSTLLKDGGAIGAAIAALVVVIGLLLRQKMPFTGADMSEFGRQARELEKRVGQIEADIKHLPTREEFHALNLQNALLSERLSSVEKVTKATNEAITRIENHVYDRSKGGA